MDRTLSLFAGIELGAGLMDFLDPEMCRRRRALLRDQVVSATSRIDDCLDATWSDIRQEILGGAARPAS